MTDKINIKGLIITVILVAVAYKLFGPIGLAVIGLYFLMKKF